MKVSETAEDIVLLVLRRSVRVGSVPCLLLIASYLFAFELFAVVEWRVMVVIVVVVVVRDGRRRGP